VSITLGTVYFSQSTHDTITFRIWELHNILFIVRELLAFFSLIHLTPIESNKIISPIIKLCLCITIYQISHHKLLI